MESRQKKTRSWSLRNFPEKFYPSTRTPHIQPRSASKGDGKELRRYSARRISAVALRREGGVERAAYPDYLVMASVRWQRGREETLRLRGLVDVCLRCRDARQPGKAAARRPRGTCCCRVLGRTLSKWSRLLAFPHVRNYRRPRFLLFILYRLQEYENIEFVKWELPTNGGIYIRAGSK